MRPDGFRYAFFPKEHQYSEKVVYDHIKRIPMHVLRSKTIHNYSLFVQFHHVVSDGSEESEGKSR
jgi:hypothetical protein